MKIVFRSHLKVIALAVGTFGAALPLPTNAASFSPPLPRMVVSPIEPSAVLGNSQSNGSIILAAANVRVVTPSGSVKSVVVPKPVVKR